MTSRPITVKWCSDACSLLLLSAFRTVQSDSRCSRRSLSVGLPAPIYLCACVFLSVRLSSRLTVTMSMCMSSLVVTKGVSLHHKTCMSYSDHTLIRSSFIEHLCDICKLYIVAFTNVRRTLRKCMKVLRVCQPVIQWSQYMGFYALFYL